ncbi:MAG TPA: serine hydrolase domain-containing protein [Longimicrobium sp.]|nr:serine hydrolase domain-containing protein [Longimicrobium sp.]
MSVTEATDRGDAAGPSPEEDEYNGWFSRRRRPLVWVMLAAFAAALALPFFTVPRLRYALRAVPRIPSRSLADIRPVTAALAGAETVVQKEVRRQGFPGAALAIGVRDTALLDVGVGRTRWGRLAPPVDPDRTLYDLASLTKLVATTTAVMVLVDDGRMRLDDPVAKFLPSFTGGGREKVTIRHLLTHTSGLTASARLEGSTPGDRLYNVVAHSKLIAEPGEDVLYSDAGFAILGLAVSSAARQPLPAFLRKRVWEPLGMNHTRFQPGIPCDSCAPTLTLDDGTPFAGKTNDPFARELGGITGNAGLFSTAADVARWAAMIANGGELNGVRVVRAETVRQFEQLQPGAGTRALGFEWFCAEGTVPDNQGCKEPYAFGHTGYTGTSVWIEPGRGTWVVLLSNRTYMPHAPNRIRKVRRDLYNVVTGRAPAPPPIPADTAPEH